MRLRIYAAGLTLALASVASGQEIPDTIAADGVPAVSKDVPAMLGRYQNGKTAAFQDWVAGRREILFSTRSVDTNQIYLAPSPNGERAISLGRFVDGGGGCDGASSGGGGGGGGAATAAAKKSVEYE